MALTIVKIELDAEHIAEVEVQGAKFTVYWGIYPGDEAPDGTQDPPELFVSYIKFGAVWFIAHEALSEDLDKLLTAAVTALHDNSKN